MTSLFFVVVLKKLRLNAGPSSGAHFLISLHFLRPVPAPKLMKNADTEKRVIYSQLYIGSRALDVAAQSEMLLEDDWACEDQGSEKRVVAALAQ